MIFDVRKVGNMIQISWYGCRLKWQQRWTKYWYGACVLVKRLRYQKL